MADRLRFGAIVKPAPNDPLSVLVLKDQVLRWFGFADEVVDAGWQVAETSDTRARILVRVVPGDEFWVPAWHADGVGVEVASIETGVEEVDGRWWVPAGLGAIEAKRWLARRSQVGGGRMTRG